MWYIETEATCNLSFPENTICAPFRQGSIYLQSVQNRSAFYLDYRPDLSLGLPMESRGDWFCVISK